MRKKRRKLAPDCEWLSSARRPCLSCTMPESLPGLPPSLPVSAGGKWLRQGPGDGRWPLRGVSYGPFAPNEAGEPYPPSERLWLDFAHLQSLGFNTVRLYELPTAEVLAAAEKCGLRLLCGIPWTDHVDFLANPAQRRQIRQQVVEVVTRLKAYPQVVGFLVGNEIEKTLVRWMGPAQVRDFLDDLITAGKEAAPEHLFSYATYPSTEYLIPSQADFLAMNVYLEEPDAFRRYLRRLQNLAADKPLVITEFGLDVAAHGEQAQTNVFHWFHSICEEEAVAGTVWFSYTDEWQRGAEPVTEWKFGLVDAGRRERAVCARLKSGPVAAAATEAARQQPGISIIVCTYNGTSTLRACLQSLQTLNYPDYEVLLVDDGSTLDISEIAHAFPTVRYIRQEHAGLSVARNLGAERAKGEILAYTDDDCIADPDWLTYLAQGFDEQEWVAAGGPNIPPKPRNRTEAVVAAAPGAPAHVLLSDTEAEHLPGCNLAIRKAALQAIGGFRAQYRAAGDDVDVCWRLREAGGRLRFVAGAMVWHHRRYSVSAYFRQQAGYGRAEALLMKDHPGRFGTLGGARWLGGIYGDRAAAPPLDEGKIYHGPRGEGLFQGIYRQDAGCWLDWAGGLPWIAGLLLALAFRLPLVAAAVFSLSLVLAVCRLRHLTHAPFSLNLRESSLLLGLCWWQPVVREWARVCGMVRLKARPAAALCTSAAISHRPAKLSVPLGETAFWIEGEQDHQRTLFLDHLVSRLGEDSRDLRVDDGWRLFDVESRPQHSVSTAYVTVMEYHNRQQRLLRVRSLLRVRRSMCWAAAAACMLALAALRVHASLPLLALAVLGLSVFGLRLRYRTSTRERIQEAARRAGLQAVNGCE